MSTLTPYTIEKVHTIKLMLPLLPFSKAIEHALIFPLHVAMSKYSPSCQRSVPPLRVWISPCLPTQELYSFASLFFLINLFFSLCFHVSMHRCSSSSCLERKPLLTSYPPQTTAWSVSASLEAWSTLAKYTFYLPLPPHQPIHSASISTLQTVVLTTSVMLTTMFPIQRPFLYSSS